MSTDPTLCQRQTGGDSGTSDVVSRLERIALFNPIADAEEAVARFDLSGTHVASASFLVATARYSQADRVDIIVPPRQLREWQDQLDLIARDRHNSGHAEIQLSSEDSIPALLKHGSPQVLHDPADFIGLTYIRSRYHDRIVPITSSQMGVSYSCDLHTYFLALLAAPRYPCDSIVCSTSASRLAMARRLTDLAERYGRVWGGATPTVPRLEQIPWGVDTERFAPRDPRTARRDLNLPLDRPILLCLGRVRIQDKMDWTPLLLAFQRLRRATKRQPLLVIAGAETGYSRYLLDQATQLGLRDHIRTFFSIPPAALPSLYAACDIFVSPTDSPSESFGLTIVEAMACGRPVVASDWDGYKELIVHGETGFKVRTDWADCLHEVNELAPFMLWDHEHLHVGQSVSVDVAELVSYLVQLLESEELREKMGREARARAKALYDWPVVIRQWEELWSELGAIASTLTKEESNRLDYLQPNYFQHFSHYATRIIEDPLPIELTARGIETLAGREPLYLHPWARGFLHPEQLMACLQALRPGRWMRAQLRVGDILQVMQKTRGLTRDNALMHLMWLAKYDLLSIGPCE